MPKLHVGEEGKDPLLSIDKGKELFLKLNEVASGYPMDVVALSACNLLLNTIRQSHPAYKDADNAVTALMEGMRETVAEHYDGAGKRRSVFPHDQEIIIPPPHEIIKVRT